MHVENTRRCYNWTSFHSTQKLLNIWNILKHCTCIQTNKQTNKQNIKNYRLVSLLPIFSKVFERIIYDNILKYILDKNLISPKRFRFRPGESCVNRPLSITHYIFTSFDNGLEVREVFLNISKAFDKVWHNGLIYKLKQNDIKDKLLSQWARDIVATSVFCRIYIAI